MTKIEQYIAAKATASRIEKSAAVSLGRDSPNNDKHEFSCSFIGLANESWQPMKFSVHCSYGYYGSSSGYSASSDDLGRYLARAIEQCAATLLDCAVAMAKADAETVRLAAESEAREVLAATS